MPLTKLSAFPVGLDLTRVAFGITVTFLSLLWRAFLRFALQVLWLFALRLFMTHRVAPFLDLNIDLIAVWQRATAPGAR